MAVADSNVLRYVNVGVRRRLRVKRLLGIGALVALPGIAIATYSVVSPSPPPVVRRLERLNDLERDLYSSIARYATTVEKIEKERLLAPPPINFFYSSLHDEIVRLERDPALRAYYRRSDAERIAFIGLGTLCFAGAATLGISYLRAKR